MSTELLAFCTRRTGHRLVQPMPLQNIGLRYFDDRLRIGPGIFLETMGNSDLNGTTDSPAPGRFPPTHWSVVMGAGKGSSPSACEALGRLYQAYLPPLLGYLRYQGCSEDESRELAQGFFEYLLEHRSLGKVQPTGKFRSWLLACLKHFLSDAWDRARAAKRGGAAAHIPLRDGEEEEGVEPVHPGPTPDHVYEQQFTLRFLQRVMEQLEQDYQSRGKTILFEHFHPFLMEKQDTITHADLAKQFGMSEAQVSQEISRLRKRYRDLFDQELETLLGSRDELEEEKQFMFATLRT